VVFVVGRVKSREARSADTRRMPRLARLGQCQSFGGESAFGGVWMARTSAARTFFLFEYALLDKRGLTRPEDTSRLSKPAFPSAAPPEFVRGLGPVRMRDQEPSALWRGQRTYVDCSGLLGNRKLVDWTGVYAGDLKIRPYFLRLYGDGVVLRLALAMVGHARRTDLRDETLLSMGQTVAELWHGSVDASRGSHELRSLHTQFAKWYEFSSQKHPSSPENSIATLDPILFAESSGRLAPQPAESVGRSRALLPYTWRAMDRHQLGTSNVESRLDPSSPHCYGITVRTRHEEVPVWIIPRHSWIDPEVASPFHTQNTRVVRQHLGGFHALRCAYERVSRMVAFGDLQPDSDAVKSWVMRTRRRLEAPNPSDQLAAGVWGLDADARSRVQDADELLRNSSSDLDAILNVAIQGDGTQLGTDLRQFPLHEQFPSRQLSPFSPMNVHITKVTIREIRAKELNMSKDARQQNVNVHNSGTIGVVGGAYSENQAVVAAADELANAMREIARLVAEASYSEESDRERALVLAEDIRLDASSDKRDASWGQRMKVRMAQAVGLLGTADAAAANVDHLVEHAENLLRAFS
jgi:hypothetical protein